MLFNSVSFIFAFLPMVLAGYYVLALSPFSFLRRPFLIASTLAFYGLAGAQFLPLLLASVIFNFGAGHAISWLGGRVGAKQIAVAVAVIGNLVVLGYFKYFNFLLSSFDAAFGIGFELERILLPLGISFFTFQQIGYLIDISRG